MGKGIRAVRSYRGKWLKGRIVQGDALEFLRSLRAASADLVFLDPPFNLGKLYTQRRKDLDRRSQESYHDWMEAVLSESVRVLRAGGTLYLYHIPYWAMHFGRSLAAKLTFQHWIAISMKNGFMRGKGLYPAHYALLMFTKGQPARFSRPKLRPKKCRCGRYVKDYGGYRAIIEERGINLSDFWDDLSPVRHAHRKHRQANELPAVLFDRVIQMSGGTEIVYLDPFAGSGSGVIAAARAGLHFSACDIVRANCRIVCNRLDGLRQELAQRRD